MPYGVVLKEEHPITPRRETSNHALIMPYGKLRIPYVTISLVPYAISCIFFKGISYGTIIGVVAPLFQLNIVD
jgi:hypothetical protein